MFFNLDGFICLFIYLFIYIAFTNFDVENINTTTWVSHTKHSSNYFPLHVFVLSTPPTKRRNILHGVHSFAHLFDVCL